MSEKQLRAEADPMSGEQSQGLDDPSAVTRPDSMLVGGTIFSQSQKHTTPTPGFVYKAHQAGLTGFGQGNPAPNAKFGPQGQISGGPENWTEPAYTTDGAI